MGGNLARNFSGRGIRTAVYTRSHERRQLFAKSFASQEKCLIPCESPAVFCHCLERPRKILIMVKAGEAVDSVIETLRPFLERGDILIDGGNSHYLDSKRRAETLEQAGIRFVGMGISGGESGALHGPSLMPGAEPDVWNQIRGFLEQIAAKAPDGTPCCASLGNSAAGHFVKMVHNGIEYADMQLISEAWMLLKHLPVPPDIPAIFREWNHTELESYLIGITADILEKRDPVTGRPLVEMILDKAGQKGTGLWTAYAALDLGIPASGIMESVFARMLSAFKEKRISASEKLPEFATE
jgi:6-phosphogluconate dehydrogenase